MLGGENFMSTDKILEKRTGEKVNDAPHVSVIIPAYNCAEFIGETLESVFRQTFKNYEIVLVNDGSPDTQILEKTLCPYFENLVYIKQKNGGAAAARNAGIENSGGVFLAFLDGDDVWLPEFLASQLAFLAQNNYDMVYADALLFGERRTDDKTFMENSPSVGAADFEGIVSGRCNVITSGTIVHKQKIFDAGMFDASLSPAAPEDFDMWVRLVKAGVKIGYQKKALLKYRVRLGGLSGSSIQRARRSIISFNTVKEKFDLTPAEAEILEKRLAEAEAEYHLETGKAHLLREEFADARKSFRAANEFYRKPKLKIIDLMLAISPKTMVKIFKKHRAGELPFIHTTEF